MIIEIALGIVLAVLILVFWQHILVLSLFLVVVGIALIIVFLIIVAAVNSGFAYPEIFGTIGLIAVGIWLIWEMRRQESAKKAKLAETESNNQAATIQRK